MRTPAMPLSHHNMPLSTATLWSGTAEQSDGVLNRVVDVDGTLSTCFLAAANADQIIYQNHTGNRIYGDESSRKG